MNDPKKINKLLMKSVLVLLPAFIVPALVAVIIIKKYDMSSLQSLLLIACALLVSWFVVFQLLARVKKSLKSE